jgi:hypothetical protein
MKTTGSDLPAGDPGLFLRKYWGWKEQGKPGENPDLEVSYRFASYDPYNKTPEHVFCVVKEYGKEYWIDPVLDKFNQRKEPYFYKDKKLNTMALVGLSGIENANDQIGSIDWGKLIEIGIKTTPDIINVTKGGQGGGMGGASPTPAATSSQSMRTPG